MEENVQSFLDCQKLFTFSPEMTPDKQNLNDYPNFLGFIVYSFINRF